MNRELRILVIDDDEFDRKNVERSLRSLQPKPILTFATTAKEGLDRISKADFDCILLDYRLPGMDGGEMLTEIRKDGIKTPVIIMTSQGSEEIAVNMMKEGASHYMTKEQIEGGAVEGTLLGVIRFHESETRKNLAEQALKERNAQLQLVFQATPVILFTLGIDGEITLIEGAGLDLIGGKPAVWIGKEISELFPKTLEIKRDVTSVLSGEQVVRESIRGNNTFEIHLHPLRDAYGINGVLGLAIDISDRKVAETQLREAKELAEQTAKAKEDFLANMSHEIRTPMNAILGFTHLLAKSGLNPEQQGYLNSIGQAGETLLTIINDILDLSKIEAGKLSFSNVPFSAKEILEHIASIFGARIQEKGLTMKLEIGDDIPPVVDGDPNRLKQVLINLVGNAIKFTSEGSITIAIGCGGREDGICRMKFRVTDTGIGIPKEKQDTIWESFSQASNETTRLYGGTGLGLTISRRIVELQDGEIGLQSTPGVGSEFSFMIPYRISDKTLESISSEGSEEQITLRSDIKVLVAEDNKMNRTLAEKILEGYGFELTLVENGDEAVKAVKAKDFHVVLMDIQMPVMDGIAATEFIRGQLSAPKSEVPIVALTAHAIDTEKKRCEDAGMNGYMTKPFDPIDLYQKIVFLADRNGTDLVKGSSPEARAKGSTWFDLDYLLGISGGNDQFLSEIVDIFLDRVPDAMQNMRSCSDKRDWQELYRIAHTIKPSYVMFGGDKVNGLFSELISSVVAPEVAETKVEAQISQLEHITTDMVQSASEFRKTLN